MSDSSVGQGINDSSEGSYLTNVWFESHIMQCCEQNALSTFLRKEKVGKIYVHGNVILRKAEERSK